MGHELKRPLRIHPGENVPNSTVLPAGIERLQDDEERSTSIGVEQVLQLLHALDVSLDVRQSLVVALVPARVG
jgi:hypothetical protein